MEYLIEWQVLDSPDLYFERVTKQTNKVTSKSRTSRSRTEQTNRTDPADVLCAWPGLRAADLRIPESGIHTAQSGRPSGKSSEFRRGNQPGKKSHRERNTQVIINSWIQTYTWSLDSGPWEAGCIITPLSHVANSSNYLLDGTKVTILI